jgi:hypothetical protein
MAIAPGSGRGVDRLPLIDLASSRKALPAVQVSGSGNLVVELPALIAELADRGLLVKRVVYNPVGWNGTAADDHGVSRDRPGTADGLSPNRVRLFLSGSRRIIDLLIIFPAGHAMKPTVSVAAAGAPHPQQDLQPEEEWESEGGWVLQ